MNLFANLVNTKEERHAWKRKASASPSERVYLASSTSKSEAPKREHDTVAPLSGSRRPDLNFPLDSAEKVGEHCSIDAFNKGTTPVGSAVDTLAFADSLTRQTQKNRPATTSAPLLCLHGCP
jgi:hypothetical protein